MWTAEEVYPKPHKSIACNKICVMKLLGARRLLAGLTLLLLLPSPAPSPAPTLSGPELIGFSFSPSALAAGGPSAESTLAKLMARLHPDLVRLPVYHREHGPQHLVPGDYVTQRRLQRGGVQVALQP